MAAKDECWVELNGTLGFANEQDAREFLGEMRKLYKSHQDRYYQRRFVTAGTAGVAVAGDIRIFDVDGEKAVDQGGQVQTDMFDMDEFFGEV